MKNIAILLILLTLFFSCQSGPSGNETEQSTILVSNELSNSIIKCINEDAFGYIWIGTESGLNRYNGVEVHQYFHSAEDSLSLRHDNINQIYCDKQGRLWVGTMQGISLYTEQDNFLPIPNEGPAHSSMGIAEDSQGRIYALFMGGIERYDEENKTFKTVLGNSNLTSGSFFFIDEKDRIWNRSGEKLVVVESETLKEKTSLALPFNPSSYLCDGYHQLWVFSRSQLALLNLSTLEWVSLPESLQLFLAKNNRQILNVKSLKEGSILLITNDGFYLYHPETKELTSQEDPSFPLLKSKNKVNDVFIDSQENTWYITPYDGVELVPVHKGVFNKNAQLIAAFEGKPVGSLLADRDGIHIWIRSVNHELFCYNQQDGKLSSFKLSGMEQGNDIDVKSMILFQDEAGAIWYNDTDNTVVQFREVNGHLEQLHRFSTPNSILTMAQDADGKLWMGGFMDGFLTYEPGMSVLKKEPLPQGEYLFPLSMRKGKDKRLAVLTIRGGLYYLVEGEPKLSAFSGALLNSAIQKGTTFHPNCMLEDSQGVLWIGTLGNGLMKYVPETHQTERIQGLTCQNVCDIQEDAKGHLWISTENGLSEIDPVNEHVKNYYSTDNIGGNQFFANSSCKTASGSLLFGGIHGLTEVTSEVSSPETNIPLYFEDLRIFNQLIRPGKGSNMKQSLHYNPEVRLNHLQNGFSISFSALEYGNQSRFTYQYKLEGVDKVWVNANASHMANYATLSPGEYPFHVRLVTNDLQTVLNEITLPITIQPALWDTWWAWLCYILAILFITWKVVSQYKASKLDKELARKAEQEKAQEMHINQMNMHFFANISHEFRTPLTVISGPLTQLCNNGRITGQEKKLLTLINRSVNRMLTLVNQMMDFNKLEEDALKLRVAYQDIVAPLNQVLAFFAINAQEKNIRLLGKGLEDYFLTWVDTDKLEKIMTNLLGNAMKYTPQNGKVVVSLDTIGTQEAQELFPESALEGDGQYVKICVSNSGSNIPEDQREKIFERYYQMENQKRGQFTFGTGIGLYYTSRLVKLHHGFIKVMDSVDTTGPCFCYLLPINESCYSEEDRTEEPTSQSLHVPVELDYSETRQEPESQEVGNQKPTLLVVDDDIEIVQYLKLLLSVHYRVICRFNATSAKETLQREENIDMVISDVIMPEVSGYQLCKDIKEDSSLCHIPVILVTAKTGIKDQVEGLNQGAIAYVTKPFDPDYLLAVIQSLLQNREATRKKLKEGTLTTELSDTNSLTGQDKAFMKHLYELMEEELDNPDMDIVRMTELMNVSRSKLYYKIKALVGENPASFFRQYKLNRAAEMIREGKYNIAEISHLTGFSSPSHFTTCFKKQFGVNPTDYV